MASRSIFVSALLGALMISQSASALSCARPDLVRSLEEAKASETIYHILVGNFTSRERGPAFPKVTGQTSPEDQFKRKAPRIMASTFEGYSLAKNRRNDMPLSRFPVDIEVSCIGPWCSDVPSPNRELIAFVEARDGQPPILRISPCPSKTFQAEEKQVQKLRQCLDQTCAPGRPRR